MNFLLTDPAETSLWATKRINEINIVRARNLIICEGNIFDEFASTLGL